MPTDAVPAPVATTPSDPLPLPLPVPLHAYRWSGYDKSGGRLAGVLRASSPALVAIVLRRRGIRPDGVRRLPAWQARRRPHAGGAAGLMHARISRKSITRFTRDLATMLEAGIPLLQALALLGDSRRPAARRMDRHGDNPVDPRSGNAAAVRIGVRADVQARDRAAHSPGETGRDSADSALTSLMAALRDDIETGTALAAALSVFPRHFDALFCNLVAVGEQTGSLALLLARLADYRERGDALKGRLRTALIYPATIVATAMLVTVVVMVWVVPAFRAVFAGFGAELPLPTLMVIALSDWLLRYWAAAISGGALCGMLCFQYWKRCITMQRMVDRLIFTLPLLGPLARHVCIARWARTLATMFTAGLPLASSLESVGKTAGNSVYLDASRRIGADLRQGSSLAHAIGDTGLFPPLVIRMVAVGEESGTLARMLGKTADFYETRVDQTIATLSALIEPCIMLVLGGLIGTLVIAMYLPIFQLGAIV